MSLRLNILLLLTLVTTPTFAVVDECVILLHGLGRTSISMLKIEWSLETDGYIVWNKGYPSRRDKIQELTAVVGDAIEYCRESKTKKIHFVTHSLGGILVREYFQDHDVAEAHRVVMLSPPNHGSEVADKYKDAWWYKTLMGPAGQQLGTDENSIPNQLNPIGLEIGIIAGVSSSDSWFSSVFQDENDGKVSTKSAQLTEMKDFLIVESGHTFIMNSDHVIHQIKAFIEGGKFIQ